MSLLDLVRPDILALEAYSSARSLGSEGSVFLDANESPWPLFEEGPVREVNRYPEPQPRSLVRSAAQIYRVRPESVLVSRGSDEGIELLTRALCESGKDRVLICPPTYGVYETAARIQGCGVAFAPLSPKDFSLDREGILAKMPTKLVYVCSPNNPTGTAYAQAEIAGLCRSLLGRSLVVVDEAYQEFSSLPSMTELLEELPNLVVLRTLSKAWGLAGARCGFALGNPELIAVLQRVRAPYPMSCASVQVAQSVFNPEGRGRMLRSVARILGERERLKDALSRLPVVETVFPSQANFLLLKVRDRKRLLDAVRAQGLVVRDRSRDPGLMDCVRITVGRPQDNDAAIRCFSEALA